MRIKKIRGHKRIWKEIEKWKKSQLNLDINYLKSQQRSYAKIYVHPFCDYSGLNSEIPQPKRATRKLILESLFEIYESWKKQLEAFNQPFYLKIWVFEPFFSNSQVVCSIGSCLDFYNTTFYKPVFKENLMKPNFDNSKYKFKNLNWEYRLHENFIDNTYVGEIEDYQNESEYLKNKMWFENKLKKKHRKIVYNEPVGDATEAYGFKLGVVWLGGEN